MIPKFKLYADPISFRQALEARLKSISKEQKIDLERLRKQVAFDRFLARIFHKTEKIGWILKGGYAMELRFSEIARATRDIDLGLPSTQKTNISDAEPIAHIRQTLQDSMEHDLKDWFTYRIESAVREIDGAPYGGARFPVEASLAGKKFTRFSVDVGVGDPALFEPQWKKDHDLLSFAGIASAKIPLLAPEQQFAEKIHTYTLPREGTPNSRTRDLVDLVLLIENGKMESEKIKKAIQITFERRKTHTVPTHLSPPPHEWEKPYENLAQDCGVKEKKIHEAFQLVTSFWSSAIRF